MSLSKEKSTAPRLRVVLLAATAFVFVAAGAGRFMTTDAAEAGSNQDAPPAPIVTVANPAVNRIIEWDEFTGRFAAVDDVEVRARVSGYLEEVAFEDGKIVKKGDLLFRIDPRPFEAALAAAKADLAGAEAELINAIAENERGQRLLARSALSQEDADRRTRALGQARAAQAAAKARVDRAALDVEFTEIRAPITGRISDNFVSHGNLIVGGAQGGSVLTTIVSLDPIYFDFTASEADYLKYIRITDKGAQAGLQGSASPVFAKLIDEDAFAREGALSFVDNRLDPSTGTMRGRATFANPDGVLSPGMFGRLKIAASGEYEALIIPDSAVQTDQGEKFVWVASKGNIAERRVVDLGPIMKTGRVVRSGLAASDKVIVSGGQFVMAGAPVAPQGVGDRIAQLTNQ